MRAAALALALTACAPKPAPIPVSASPASPPRAPLVYFVMVDRFANGDPSNDGAIDLADPHAFHGGDLQGVIDHLDHLDQLGVTHLWLSPIFAMRTDKIGDWGAFHGYWVKDLAQVEPRFGDEDTLRALTDAAHARGMKLILDMVWNHTDYDAPLRQQHPDWFHNTGDIEDWADPIQRITGQVHGLPDLAQEQPKVLEHLAQISTGWIDRAGVDGFRIDAVGHMPLPALATLNDRLDAHRPGFWTLGEDFSGDPARLAQTLDQGHFDALFDFPLRYALVDVFCHGAPVGRLASTLSLDRLYTDPTALVTFLDNHDLKRITTECDGDSGKVGAALALLFATRGTPSLTWGAELRLEGGEEPDNRRDMPWERLADPARQSDLRGMSNLAEQRARWPVLQDGRTVILGMGEGWLSIGRFSDTEAAHILLWTGDRPPDDAVPPSLLADDKAPYDRRESAMTLTRGLGLHLRLARLREGAAPPWATYLSPPATRSLILSQGGDSADRVVVGAGPELGHWKPEAGLPLVEGSARIDLPSGSAVAFKILRQGPDGPIWPEGPDTVVYLPWGPGETRIDLPAAPVNGY